MKHTEDSIRNIKKSLAEMWSLVQSQVEKSSAALLDGNKELAHEITSREKLVDSYELTVDRECENFFALLTPVAVDLRMILSIIKINNNLERIGDFADGIAHFVIHNQTEKINTELLGQLQIREMFDEVICMLKLCKSALANEDSHMAGKVFAKDTVVDRLNTENGTPAGHLHGTEPGRNLGRPLSAFGHPAYRTYRRPLQQHRRGHHFLPGC